jgi:hypothetical protein
MSMKVLAFLASEHLGGVLNYNSRQAEDSRIGVACIAARAALNEAPSRPW